MTPYTTPIVRRVARWPGVETAPHDDAVAFSLAARELGRVHESGVVDLPVPRPVRDQVLTDGLADRHRDSPGSWVSVTVRSAADVADALRLLRVAYLRERLSTGDAELAPLGPDRVRAELRHLGVSEDLIRVTTDREPSSAR